MKRVILVGSPRSNGRSAQLAEMLFEANIDERPEDELFLVPVSEIDVGPCIGCNACRAKSEVVTRDDDGNEVSCQLHRCVFDDDMQTLYDLLDDADALTVVCPVYFSGVPAPMKCVIDRLQPYFWAYREDGPRLPKRPLELHIVGEGGDPHGYAPLISEVKGPFALAGFGLERVFDWVGKIDERGEILDEAEEVPVPAKGASAQFVGGNADASQAGPTDSTAERVGAKERPKLSLSSGNNASKAGKPKEGAGKPEESSGKLGPARGKEGAGKPEAARPKERAGKFGEGAGKPGASKPKEGAGNPKASKPREGAGKPGKGGGKPRAARGKDGGGKPAQRSSGKRGRRV